MGIIDRLKSALGGKDKEQREEIQRVGDIERYKKAKVAAEREMSEEKEYRQAKEFQSQQKQDAYNKSVGGKIITGVKNISRGISRVVGSAVKPRQAVVSGRVSRGLVEQFGQRLPYNVSQSYQGKKGYAGRGRPKGSFKGKYAAFGGVYGYRRFMRKQKTLSALQQQQQMQQMVRRNPQQAYQQMAQQSQPRYVQTSEGMQELPPQTQYQAPQQQYQQPQPSQQFGKVQFGNPQESFNAFKVDFGLSPMGLKGPPINNKPINVFQQRIAAFDVEPPVSNPQGDWFTEPDFFTGKQVLRRRSNDRLFQW